MRGAPANDPTAARRPFYGWTMLGVATVAMVATSPGQTVVVSQFNTALREALGLTAATLGLAYMIGTMAAAVPLVLVGALSDRFGPRLVMGLVAVLFGLACAGMGLVAGFASLTLGFFLIRFLGQGALSLVSGHALAMWFERRLGTANGLKLVLTQLGFAATPAIALALIDAFGWRTAYALLGVGVWLAVLPLVLFVARNRPSDVGQYPDGAAAPTTHAVEHPDQAPKDPAFSLRQALATRAYWTLTGAGVLNGLIGTALIFHAQPLLSASSLDPDASAAILRTWSFTVMLCVFPAGWAADHLAPRILLPASLMLLAASCLLWLVPASPLAPHAAMGAFGLAQALAMGVVAPAVARWFGLTHHGSIRAMNTCLGVAGTGLGPVALGLSLDHLDSPAVGLIVMAGAAVALAVPAALLKPPRPPGGVSATRPAPR